MDTSTGAPPGPRLPDLPLDDLAGAAVRGGVEGWTDDELIDAVGAVLAEPREGPADSFVLHAPLELAARARLLAATPTALRPLARLRILSIAARFRTYEPLGDRNDEPGETTPDEAADPVAALGAAVAGGDLAAVDRTACALLAAAPRPAEVTAGLAPSTVARTSAAGHAPILLASLADGSPDAARWLSQIRPLSRELARRPAWRIGWPDRQPPALTGTTPDPDALFRALADPPRLGIPGSTFIHPTMHQVDAMDENGGATAAAVLGSMAGPEVPVTPATARAVTRIAALSMVRDTIDHAPYGWTHCLTMPQAVLAIAPEVEAGGGAALSVAATHVLGFRAALATATLDRTDPLLRPVDDHDRRRRRGRLVAEAARRHDAHIAKYLLAVQHAADRDPAAEEVYLAAGEHLLAVWDDLGPDPDDLLAAEAAATRSTATA
ncbi:MAG: hypothetical protein AAF547_04455 [Actinomycetota bacterium]